MANSLGLIIEREYFERVKRKSFIITTILVPIFLLAMMALPTLILIFSTPDKTTIQVVDNTGVVAPLLKGNDEVKFVSASLPVDSLRADESIENILVIGENAVDDPSHGVTLLSRGSVSMVTDSYITSELDQAIEQIRMSRYDIPDIDKIMSSIKADTKLSTIRIDKETETETSTEFSYLLALTMGMMLYMFILLYGQMVMTSIIEEKNNRVLEIMVSSVKPFNLMLGKILGVALVAVTQILIWAALIGTAVMVASPMLAGQMQSGDMPAEMTAAMSQFMDFGYLSSLLINTLLFFIGGFLLYASLYAAIGSAVSNVQDASQLSSIATVPMIVAIMGEMAVIASPDSTLSFWLSMIPFTSPTCMIARVTYGVAAWESILSLVILYATFIFAIWVCGKIYRIGIFMYGKKPSVGEVIKWAKYK